RAPGGHPGEDTFPPGEFAHRMLRVLLADVEHAIDLRLVKNARQIGLGPAADTGNAGALGRLEAYDLDGRVLFLEVGGNAHDGASGAHGADEMGDRAGGLAPDLRPRSLVMGQG